MSRLVAGLGRAAPGPGGALALAAALGIACGPAVTPASTPDPRADIRAAGDAFIGLTQDPDSAISYFADDALLIGAGGARVRGREALLRHLRAGAESGDWRSSVDRDSIFVSDPLAVERGRYRIELWEDARPSLSFTGHYVIHWERRQGRWVMGTYIGAADP